MTNTINLNEIERIEDLVASLRSQAATGASVRITREEILGIVKAVEDLLVRYAEVEVSPEAAEADEPEAAEADEPEAADEVLDYGTGERAWRSWATG